MLGVGQAVEKTGPKVFFSNPEVLLASLALVAVLLLGALALALARRWRTRLSDSPDPPEHQLEHYQALFEEGELSREEFERITGLLARPAPEGPEARPSPDPMSPPGPSGPSAPAP